MNSVIQYMITRKLFMNLALLNSAIPAPTPFQPYRGQAIEHEWIARLH